MVTNQERVNIPSSTQLEHQPSQIWRLIVDLDTAFSSDNIALVPNQRHLYLRWRRLLSRLHHRLQSDPEFGECRRADYLVVRKELLAQKYDQRSLESLPSQSPLPPTYSSDSFNVLLDKYQRRSTASVSSISQTTTSMVGIRQTGGANSISAGYAFSGIETIFDHHQGAITRLRFAHNNSACLAVASADGSVSICHLAASLEGEDKEPRINWLRPRNINTANQNSLPEAAVMDVAWSAANDFLVSVCLDGAMHLWSSEGIDGSDAPSLRYTRTLSPSQLATGGLLACEFHPGNNNLLVIAGTKGILTVVNLSTGRVVTRDQLHSPTNIQNSSPSSALCLSGLLGYGCLTALAFESAASTASCLWVGSDQGVIQAYQCSSTTGTLTRTRSLHLNPSPSHCPSTVKAQSKKTGWFSGRKPPSVVEKAIVTSLVCRSWLSSTDASSYLLVNATGGLGLLLFQVVSTADGHLSLNRRFDLSSPAVHYPSPLLLHACFAPLISFRADAACVVSGSEGGRVLVFDVFSSQSLPVTHFEGHQGAVIDVTLSWDEAVLASADVSGCVIIWRRQSNVNSSNNNNN